MYYSKYNILVGKGQGVKDASWALMNPLTGAFDLADEDEVQKLEAMKAGSYPWPDAPEADPFVSYLIERGYVFSDRREEDALVEEKEDEFKKESATSPTQILLIPTYGCNLACKYCFQKGMNQKPALMEREVVDAFFAHIARKFADEEVKPFITLFGGEPLIASRPQKELISYIARRASGEGYELAVVTNGYDLVEYLDILGAARIKEIQVTVDGPAAVHDSRRFTKAGKGTWERIMSGVDGAVRRGMPINFRVVVDRENLESLVELAGLVEEKGWLDLGPERFKTQLGRNYELFECYATPQHLLSQVDLWRAVVDLSREHPVLTRFHRPEFKGMKHLVDNGEMYLASFDTCPAFKKEWVYDLHGHIYGCTASCGREEYRVGTFYPESVEDESAIAQWQERDVLHIPECRDCDVSLICGGGCGVVAREKHGRVLSPDCRPIKELLSLGLDYYEDELAALTGDKVEQAARPAAVGRSAVSPTPATAAVTSIRPAIRAPRHDSGCLVCGKELEYRQQAGQATCVYCGASRDTYATCPDGHYVCDDCHKADALTLIRQVCTMSHETDPIALANLIMQHPAVAMHGPEHHALVPGVIAATYRNITGELSLDQVEEAINRGAAIPGGTCGNFGACGAGVGAGAAMSVIDGTTPLSKESWSRAGAMTARALQAIAAQGGPRCCKRCTWTALEEAMDFIEEAKGIRFPRSPAEGHCHHSGRNRECLGKTCRFNRHYKPAGGGSSGA
ncbi:MAG: DUF5714 domain-containing protein [Syntrophothermus sp.]